MLPSLSTKKTKSRWSNACSSMEGTIAKSNNWQPKAVNKRDVPVLDFTGGGSRTLTLELFVRLLRAARTGYHGVHRSALEAHDIDPSLRDGKSDAGRPPRVSFHWGRKWSFSAVITSLSVRYILFRDDGSPVRAIASVTFQEAEIRKRMPGKTPPRNRWSPGANGGKCARTIRWR